MFQGGRVGLQIRLCEVRFLGGSPHLTGENMTRKNVEYTKSDLLIYCIIVIISLFISGLEIYLNVNH